MKWANYELRELVLIRSMSQDKLLLSLYLFGAKSHSSHDFRCDYIIAPVATRLSPHAHNSEIGYCSDVLDVCCVKQPRRSSLPFNWSRARLDAIPVCSREQRLLRFPGHFARVCPPQLNVSLSLHLLPNSPNALQPPPFRISRATPFSSLNTRMRVVPLIYTLLLPSTPPPHNSTISWPASPTLTRARWLSWCISPLSMQPSAAVGARCITTVASDPLGSGTRWSGAAFT
ncbi:hypothetical protein R3P38DRAFT_830030 [Favolaschia claudopus]|uniref:Uncharacterized protein n=1 Tax=Favolaschia claudopus TaxID=2862362 RepID=A0AAW0BYS1_9AGAR